MPETPEQFLAEVMTQARAKFPDVGVLFYAVVDDEAQALREIVCVTNLDPDEIDDVMTNVSSENFEVMNSPKGRLLS